MAADADTPNQSSAPDQYVITSNGNDIEVKLNIGGRIFTTLRKTLLKIRTSRLGKVLDELEIPENCRKVNLFYDRDPTLFNAILGCYRDGQMHVPQFVCVDLLKRELKFWEISMDYMAPCCLYWVGEKTGQQETLNELDRLYYVEYESIVNKAHKRSKICGKLATVWLHLEYAGYSRISLVWAIFISMVTTMSVINISISFSPLGRTTIPGHVNKTVTNSSHSHLWIYVYENTELSTWLLASDVTFNVILTIEFALRLITVPDKLDFFKSFHTWLDLVTIIPYWFFFSPYLFIKKRHPYYIVILQTFITLRILKLNRLAAIFRGLQVMFILVHRNLRELCTLVVLFLLGTMVFALLVFEIEIQTDNFPNIIKAYWWAIVTMTTVGFGDYYPTTPFGYVIGGLCVLSGLLLTGMIIPIIGNNFTIYYNYTKTSTKKLEIEELRAKSIKRSKNKNCSLVPRNNIEDIDEQQTRV